MMTNRVLVLAVSTALPACFLQGCKDESGGGGGGDKPDIKKENELKKLVDDAGYTPEQRHTMAKMMQELFKEGDKDSKVQFTSSDDIFQKDPQSLVAYLFTHNSEFGNVDITPFNDECFTAADIQKPFETEVNEKTKDKQMKMPEGQIYPQVDSVLGLMTDVVVKQDTTFITTPNEAGACAATVMVRYHNGKDEHAHMKPDDKPAEEKADLARKTQPKKNKKKVEDVKLHGFSWLRPEALPYGKKNNGVVVIASPPDATKEGFHVATEAAATMVIEANAEAQSFEMAGSKSTAEFTVVNALTKIAAKRLSFEAWSYWREYMVTVDDDIEVKTIKDFPASFPAKYFPPAKLNGEVGANRPDTESALYSSNDQLKTMYGKINFAKVYEAFDNEARVTLVQGGQSLVATFVTCVQETNAALLVADPSIDVTIDDSTGMPNDPTTYRNPSSKKLRSKVEEIIEQGWDYNVQGDITFPNNPNMYPIAMRYLASQNGPTRKAIGDHVWKQLNDMFSQQDAAGRWAADTNFNLGGSIHIPKVLLKFLAENTKSKAKPDEKVFPAFENWNTAVKAADDDDESKLKGYAQFDSAGRLESLVINTLQVQQCSTDVEMLGAQIVAMAGVFAGVYQMESDDTDGVQLKIYLGMKNTPENTYNDKGNKCVNPEDPKEIIECITWEQRCIEKEITATKKSLPAKILFQGKDDKWSQGWKMALEAIQADAQAPKAAAPAA